MTANSRQLPPELAERDRIGTEPVQRGGESFEAAAVIFIVMVVMAAYTIWSFL